MWNLCLLICFASCTLIVCQQTPPSNKAPHPYNFAASTRSRNIQNPIEHKRVSFPQFSGSRTSTHTRKSSNKKNGVPSYAVQMEPVVQYSQPDPLYTIEKQYISEAKPVESSSNDLIKSGPVPAPMLADVSEAESISRVGQISHARLRPPTHLSPPPPGRKRPNRQHHHHHHHPPHHVEHMYGTYYEGPPEAFEAPEPIIEIIIRESNESLPAPPPIPTPPPPKKMKEPVQVFYVKYKKDPAVGYGGEEKVIYDAPIPAVTPAGNNEDSNEGYGEPEQVQEEPQYGAPAYGAPPQFEEATAPPPPSTTLKAIIHPDSETFHANGVHITFGESHHNADGAEIGQEHHGEHQVQQSAPEPAVAFPTHSPKPHISRSSTGGTSILTKRNPAPFNGQVQQQQQQQQFQPNFPSAQPQPSAPPTFQQTPQFQPREFKPPHHNPTQYSTLPQNYQFVRPQQQPNAPLAQPQQPQQPQRYTTINNPPPAQPQYHTINQTPSNQQPNFQNFPQQGAALPLSNGFQQQQQRAPTRVSPEDQHQQQVEQVNRLQQQQQQLQQQIAHQHRFQHQQPFAQQQHAHSPFSPQPAQSQFSQQASLNQFPQRPAQLSQFSQQASIASQPQFPQQQQFSQYSQQPAQPQFSQQASQPQAPRPTPQQQIPVQQYNQQLPQLQYSTSAPAVVKSVDQTRKIQNHRQEPVQSYVPTARPHPPTRAPSTVQQYYRTSTAPTTTELEEIVTEDPKKVEKDKKRKEEQQKKNIANLPDEVPADLREQLLSSGILSNADIQILDYDKIGDIPIENLPPEALANFQQVAGSERVQVVRRPDIAQARDLEDSASSSSEQRPVTLKTEDGDMEMKVVRYNPDEDRGVADRYMKKGATQLAPVVLNDNKYNRYLPLQVSGAQFPVPDVPELRGRNVTSVVVLAPVDYEFLNRRDRGDDNSEGRVGRSAQPVLEVQGVHFVAGDVLKALVRMPSTENYRRWLEKENKTAADKQSVVLLVVEPSLDHPEKEIFMYDIASGRVSKLRGELSSTFVQVAESNSHNQDLEEISDSPAAPGGDFTLKNVSRLVSRPSR